MLFSQVVAEYKWLNLNPKCVFIFCDRPSMYKRDRLVLEEDYPGFRFIFLPTDFEIDFECNQVHESFFKQNIVARVFPRDNFDYTFLADDTRPYSMSHLRFFMDYLFEINQENKHRHFDSLKGNFPYENEIDDLLQEEGVWSIDESITYVNSFIIRSKELNNHVSRPRINARIGPHIFYNYGFLRLERVEPKKFGRKDSTDGWFRLIFNRSESTSHETDIKFPTALSKILYLFMLNHTGERFRYSEMCNYKDEIYAIAKTLYYEKRSEAFFHSAVRSLTHYGDDFVDPTNDDLSGCRKEIRKAFQHLDLENGPYYEIQDDWSEGNGIRSRYLNIPKENINLTDEFAELVERFKREYSTTEGLNNLFAHDIVSTSMIEFPENIPPGRLF